MLKLYIKLAMLAVYEDDEEDGNEKCELQNAMKSAHKREKDEWKVLHDLSAVNYCNKSNLAK